MRPEVAEGYLKEVSAQFEKFAKDRYIPALRSTETDESSLLAALRYVATRNVVGHESTLREIYTTRYKGRIGTDIAQAALDALLTTTDDPDDAARFLVLAATAADPVPVVRISLTGLTRLGKGRARQAMLAELLGSHSPERLVAIAQALTDDSGVRSPIPLAEWKKADASTREAAAEQWRERIDAAGKLK